MAQDSIEDTLNALLEISKTVVSSLDLERVDELILKQACKLFSCDSGALFILDEKSNHFTLAAARGFKEDELENLKVLGAWERINQMIMDSRGALVVNDVKDLPFCSFISLPLEIEGETKGILTLSNKESSCLFTEAQQRLLVILANFAAIALANAKLYQQTEELFISLITSLVAAIDAKDPYTAGHSQRVTQIALGIAEELNLPRLEIKNLRLAAILHDIGKIGISELILTKPGELTEEEFNVIKQHPQIGVRIVGCIPHSERFIRGISEHHEYFNGEGYQRLREEGISLQGRIIAVADTFDALTSDRAYRKGKSLTEACEEIRKNAGVQFDPKVAEAFLRIKNVYHR